MPIESHPLQPFLPSNAKVLLLGSFPPPNYRWSMPFFYPNYQNDMWRIMGILFFGDKDYFSLVEQRQFDYRKVVDFCTEKGIALFDTASVVRRLNSDASDKFLEIVQPTDVDGLLNKLPQCVAVAATGQKAAEVLAEKWQCAPPAVGTSVQVVIDGRKIDFFRMPSSSRAYPLALAKKAAAYRMLFESAGMLSSIK